MIRNLAGRIALAALAAVTFSGCSQQPNAAAVAAAK